MTPLGFRLLGYVSQECVASWKIKVISKYNIYFGHLGGIKKRHEQFNEVSNETDNDWAIK